MNFTTTNTYTLYSHSNLQVLMLLFLQQVISAEFKLSSQAFEHECSLVVGFGG